MIWLGRGSDSNFYISTAFEVKHVNTPDLTSLLHFWLIAGGLALSCLVSYLDRVFAFHTYLTGCA